MVTDPISDYLTRVRNAISANHRVVEIPASNLKKEITKVMREKGYIRGYKFVDEGPQGTIKIALKYDPTSKRPAIEKLQRISKPSRKENSPVITRAADVRKLTSDQADQEYAVRCADR